MTRESHDPLGALAGQNLAAHYRRLADAATKAAAELAAEDVDPDALLIEVEDRLDGVLLAHRSLVAARLGRARAAAARAAQTARRRRGEAC